MSSWTDYLDDKGNQYRNKMECAKELQRRPSATFIQRDVSMTGNDDKDITEEINRFLQYLPLKQTKED